MYCKFIFVHMMVWKSIRFFILLVMTVSVVRSTREVYTTVYQLLDFQIALYKYLLITQNHISDIKTTASSWIQSLLNFLWAGNEGKSELLNTSTLPWIEEQVSSFANKLKLISGIISWIVWLVLWKLLFDMIVWVKLLIARIKLFIRQPLPESKVYEK